MKAGGDLFFDMACGRHFTCHLSVVAERYREAGSVAWWEESCLCMDEE